MGIQINGQTDTISSTDGSLNIGGTVTVQVTGDATGLTGTPDITVGAVTASSATISGDLTVNGTTTTLDTTLTEVDKLEVGANNTTVGVAITQSGTGDILRLYDGASQVVTVKDGGSVGIGTDNPFVKLHVVSSGTEQVRLSKNGAEGLEVFLGNNTDVNLFQHINRSSNTWVENRQNALRHTFANSGNGNEVFRIESNGNVGIGTDNPASTLDVRSNDTRFKLTSNGSGQTVGMTLKGGASDGFTYNFIESISDVDSQNWYIGGNGTANTFAVKTGGSEKLRISSSGKVGIGTNDPKQKLSVLGRTSFDIRGDYYGAWIDGDTDGTSSFNVGAWYNVGGRLRDDGNHVAVETMNTAHHLQLQPNGGNVGIGLSYPDAKLQIYQSDSTNYSTISDQRSEAEIRITNPLETAGTFSSIHFYNGGGTGGDISLNAVKAGNYASHFTIKQRAGGASTDWRERLRITSSGNVGISSATPNDLLDVYGGSICKTGTGSNYSPHVIVRDKNGRIRYFEYYFNCVKNSDFNTATDAYILDITNIGTFFQASFELVYGTRLQSVTQQVTQTNTKTFGVNRFNSGNVAVTDENDISVDSNSNTYSDVTMDALSSSGVRLKVAFSSSLGPSSFCSGVLRAWGVNDILEHESYQTLTFYNGV